MSISATDALDLPVSERIQLVAEIWESIAAHPERIELTEDTRRLLQQRLEAYRANPESGSPWEEVKARILNG